MTPSTAESSWTRWGGLQRLTPLALAPPHAGARAAVLAPHPDDETLALGATMPALAAAGWRLDLLVVTDGEAAYPSLPPPARLRLAAERQRESAAALAALGLAQLPVRWLGLPDAGVAAREAELAATLRGHLAGAGLVLAPWEGDGHSDHEAVGRAALDAARTVGARCWRYPVWAWHWCPAGAPELPWPQARQLRLDPVARGRKARAVAAYTSQLHPPAAATEAPVLPPDVLAHFERDVEVLFVGAQG